MDRGSEAAGGSILWRRLDRAGHEAACLARSGAGRVLTGCAVFANEDAPAQLRYEIVCDADWRTRSAQVSGFVGEEAVDLVLRVDERQRWEISGRECPEVEGCLDLDLNFSPSTNLLPIRRLELPVGGEAEVRAAWLRFPGFKLEPLVQRYRRTGRSTYRYESAGGTFHRELRVDELGFVTDYPGFWRAEPRHR